MTILATLLAGAMLMHGSTPARPAETQITSAGPQGDLSGTMVQPADPRAMVLIIPGSGPTDRDGNNPLAGRPAPYKLLAEALAGRNIGSVRIDKRGMFGSKNAVADANDVTIAAYVEDTRSWVETIRSSTGTDCVWLAGHSEGSLVALAAAQEVEGLCGLLLIATVGRPLGETLREQLESNPANAPILPDALGAIDALESGERVDISGMHPALAGLFAPPVQGFLIDLFSYDPAQLAGETRLPILIIQGEEDIQTTLGDARRIAAAQPDATLKILPRVNHILKEVTPDDRSANIASYSNPKLPVAPAVVDAIDEYIAAHKHGG